MSNMKRVCLYAGFSSTGVIEDHVVHSIKELSNYADVYYFAANDISDIELCKIEKYTKGRWGSKHDRYDFGSWQKLMFILGWQFIEKYDFILLMNDSCYGPLFSLDRMFQKMDDMKYDMWGITLNYGVHAHLQSYFLHISKKIFNTPFFKNFFETIIQQSSKALICINYEIGLSKLVFNHGFSVGSYIDRKKLDILEGVDITEYQNTLLQAGCPFIKRKVFTENGFAKEDKSETLKILQKYAYPHNFFHFQQPTDEEYSASNVKAPSVDKQQPRPLFSRAVRRLFMFFYSPIKNRIVNKIDKIHEQSYNAINEQRKEFSELERRLSDINAQTADSLHLIQELHGYFDWMQRENLTPLNESMNSDEKARGIVNLQYPKKLRNRKIGKQNRGD